MSAHGDPASTAIGQGDPYGRVREFLAEANVRPEFAARALARIEAQHDELADSFLWCSLTALVTEICEEAEDLAAWSGLLATRIEHDGGDPFAARRARALLAAVTQRAGEADTMLSELRRLIERPT